MEVQTILRSAIHIKMLHYINCCNALKNSTNHKKRADDFAQRSLAIHLKMFHCKFVVMHLKIEPITNNNKRADDFAEL